MEGRAYCQKVDIFSLGVMFFEILHPFETQMERVKVCGALGNILCCILIEVCDIFFSFFFLFLFLFLFSLETRAETIVHFCLPINR